MNSIEIFKHHIFLLFGIGTAYLLVNCSYSLLKEPVYPGIDWKTLPTYIFVVSCGIVGSVAFVINYYYWKLVKLPRIKKKENNLIINNITTDWKKIW